MHSSTDKLITVVIPVYNRPDLIERTIRSVIAQTYRPFSLIIVDNNSNDNTFEIVTNFVAECSDDLLDISLLSEGNPGATYARNCGLNAVETEWTMFFDSDDVMMPGHIERAMNAILANPDADIIGWNIDAVSLSGKRKCLPFEPKNITFNNLFHGSLSTLRYMARTELFRKAGGWNTAVTVWDDIELGARLLKLNPTIVKSRGKKTVIVHAQTVSLSGASYVERIDCYQPALDSIARSLPNKHKHWVQLKKTIIGATIVREGCSRGKRLYIEALQATPSLWHRMLWRLAYTYTSHGGRAIARLLRPLL